MNEWAVGEGEGGKRFSDCVQHSALNINIANRLTLLKWQDQDPNLSDDDITWFLPNPWCWPGMFIGLWFWHQLLCDYSETQLTRKPSFMVPAWLMIICWVYLELLVITRTDKLRLVPSSYLFFGWMCLHSYVTSLASFIFFSHEKKIS